MNAHTKIEIAPAPLPLQHDLDAQERTERLEVQAILARAVEEIDTDADTSDKSEQRTPRTDDEVIAYIRERGVVGPLTAGFIDEMRAHLDGVNFVQMVRKIRETKKLPELIAGLREIGGLDDFVDHLEGLRAEDEAQFAPRSWDEAVARVNDATEAERAMEALRARTGIDPTDKQTEEVRAAVNAGYRGLFQFPATTVKQIGSKLELYGDHQLYERADTWDFLEPMINDAHRLTPTIAPEDMIAAGDDVIMPAWKSVRELRAGGDNSSEELCDLELVIAHNTASSVPGAIAQLWTSVDQMITPGEAAWLREAVAQGDWQTIFNRKRDLDFEVQLVVQAIHGLTIVAGRTTGSDADLGKWDEALAEYRRVRAISDAKDDEDPAQPAAVDDYCDAMDHLIKDVRVPNFAALRTKLDFIHERCDDFSGWHHGYEEAFQLDLDHLERISIIPGISRADWDAAHGAFLKADAAFEACDIDTKKGAKRGNARFGTMTKLFMTPAPTNTELAIKLTLFAENGSCGLVGSEDFLKAFADDSRRLSGRTDA